MQLEEHSAVLGSWDLSVTGLNYGFQNSARATSASKSLNSAALPYVKAPRVAFNAMPSASPPVLSPRRVTIVTKFFCTDTEPQRGPLCVPKIRFGVDAASGRRKLAS
jgi:hypothetical protein